MTQEEFKNIVDKTCELAIDDGSKAAIDFWKKQDAGTIEIEEPSNIVWHKLIFTPLDSNLEAVEKWMPASNASILYWFTQNDTMRDEEFSYTLAESYNRYQSLLFATCDLETIQKWTWGMRGWPSELFKEDIGECLYASPWFLLVNPRRDVVEWALDTFNYMSQRKIDGGFSIITDENRQANPELKELIFKKLGKKDIDKMSLQEVVDELSVRFLDAEYKDINESEDRFMDLYDKICDEVDEIKVDSRVFIATIDFCSKDGDSLHQITTNAVSGALFDTLHELVIQDECRTCLDLQEEVSKSSQSEIDISCVTYSLVELQEELTDEILQKIFKGHHVVSFEYLLANPRKDVVEWALKHKEELGLGVQHLEFAEQYQANDEIKELIVKTLQEKGE
ncbi:MAG: hypothetical protein J6Y85_01690 [Alphaproteobacteria bacterium]|nr:hypothetical protein [Alphaproteobacteria bacterium]